MLSKKFLIAAIVLLTACNNEQKPSSSTEPATNTPAATDNTAEIEQLNKQSKECIRLMNTMEEAKAAAIAQGDAETAAACRKTIDSAARENVKIGQRLMELKQ